MKPFCPFCGKCQIQKPTKNWNYSKSVRVSHYECFCGKGFRFYKSAKNSWTIPKEVENNKKLEKVKKDICEELYSHRDVDSLTKNDYLKLIFQVKKRFEIQKPIHSGRK